MERKTEMVHRSSIAPNDTNDEISQLNSCILYIYIGGSSYEFGITSANGDRIHGRGKKCDQKRQHQSYNEILKQCEIGVQEVIHASDVLVENIVAIGVVVPVTVPDPFHRIGFAPAIPSFRGQNLARDLALRIDKILGREIPLVLENDGNAMALAEHYFGATPHLDSFVAIRLATGVSSGIVNEGKLVRGNGGIAGEIGHFPVRPESMNLCFCGAKGCLESYASGRKLLEDCQSKFNQHFTSYHDVIAAALNGEIDMAMGFKQFGKYLGKAISGIVNFFDPGLLILGGPISNAYSFFAESFYESFLRFPGIQCEVILSQLEDSKGLSAAAVVRYHILEKQIAE